mmetsp:Transcript_87220/g.241908  ORF Transcript_87220/g.241908 Transcript_87220/m.241908 type:complete len:246 (-) Transcript_87220:116-853(-)
MRRTGSSTRTAWQKGGWSTRRPPAALMLLASESPTGHSWSASSRPSRSGARGGAACAGTISSASSCSWVWSSPRRKYAPSGGTWLWPAMTRSGSRTARRCWPTATPSARPCSSATRRAPSRRAGGPRAGARATLSSRRTRTTGHPVAAAAAATGRTRARTSSSRAQVAAVVLAGAQCRKTRGSTSRWRRPASSCAPRSCQTRTPRRCCYASRQAARFLSRCSSSSSSSRLACWKTTELQCQQAPR